jgi:hypothetical protein
MGLVAKNQKLLKIERIFCHRAHRGHGEKIESSLFISGAAFLCALGELCG